MTAAARFWAVDLHVHTPGSSDAMKEHYGTPEDIVEAALAAGLDAIAITDHNTVSWCKDVADAAAGTPLVVLPGVEISTNEGHLLAIWERGTDPALIEEVLVKLDIGQAAAASWTSPPTAASPTRRRRSQRPVGWPFPPTSRRTKG